MPDLPDTNLRSQQASFAAPRAIMALILREMSTTYGRSPGGYLWAILEPAAGIALMTVIFSAGFRSPPLGSNFALFYASGLLPFMMFNDVVNKMSQTIQFSRALLAYPRVTFVDALIARLVLNALTLLLVHVIVITFILVFMPTHTVFDFSKIGMGYLMALTLAAGIGTLNSFLTLAYPLWQAVWAIVMRPMFIISCIFFTFESVPRPYDNYLWYNPLIHVIGVTRDGYYPFYTPNYVSVAYVMIIAATAGMSGLFLLHRYHRDILDK